MIMTVRLHRDINHVEDATHRTIINLIYETAPIGFLCLSVLYFVSITTIKAAVQYKNSNINIDFKSLLRLLFSINR